MGSNPPFYNHSPYGPPPPLHHDRSNGSRASSSRRFPHQDSAMGSPHRPTNPFSLNDANFDILEWHPAYLSCQRYFLDHAQHEPGTQALCALINIRLPIQWLGNPVSSSSSQSQPSSQAGAGPSSSSGFTFNNPFPPSSNSNYSNQPRISNERQANFASPVPYIRRLVVTGFDKTAILHGFFGDEYIKGIMPHVECERRNYLFAAKSGGWGSCKRQYDIGSGGGGDETLPFMKPLDEAKVEELTAAEKAWSGWLAMEDWMVGPRAPEDEDAMPSGRGAGHRGGGVSTRHMADGMPDSDLPDEI